MISEKSAKLVKAVILTVKGDATSATPVWRYVNKATSDNVAQRKVERPSRAELTLVAIRYACSECHYCCANHDSGIPTLKR